MKKYFLLVFGIFIFMIMPKTVSALSVSGNATIGRSAVMDTSYNYYYTDWKSLTSNSLNIVPIPYSGGNYYQMGSEYAIAITLNGETSFSGSVRIPVASNTIYNYTLMNGLNENDVKLGIHQNFSNYNVTPNSWNLNWNCITYPNLGVAHNVCYYDYDFSFILSEPLTGSYNLNFAILNTNGSRSSYYYSGPDSNGNAIEFPVSASNFPYSNVAPIVNLRGSGGSSSSNDNTEILDGITESTEVLQQTIQESYENLVNSQQVCNVYDINSASTVGTLSSDGSIISSSTNFRVSGFIPIHSNDTITVLSVRNSNPRYCFYNINKTVISCDIPSTVGETITIPSDASFFRYAIQSSENKPTYSVCQNGNQALYDSFNDSNVDNSSSIASGLLEDAQITDKGLTGLVATVLDFINDIFDSTCSPLSFELPFVDTTLTLPCMSTIYTTYFPDLFNLYQLITTGFIAYRVIINLFDKVKKVQDPEYDKVEVLQL